ncbi:MAG TPA: chromosome partitioning protein ParB [Leptospiraceae bacterium]|nr:chromosome partitioning protein ParB [Spirochaetaceae bacterium]HBS04500.1 chromosome partitioning protein ParB [Leptospiraceae bacterium]|tara:strand:+ start:93402 stop:94277 length:876 start_codon:yes stop_codon:yes gene_type:complete
MAKKSGLGRGLSNLIPGASGTSAPAATEGHPDYQELAIDQVAPNPDQPRKRFREQEIEELAATLLSVGLIEPIVVRRKENGYEIISGERRWRAARQAGFRKIPAVVKQVNEGQALEMAIIENIQREDLTVIEEARAYEALMGLSGAKAADVAKKVGKDRATITNLIRLLKLPEEVLELIEDRKLSGGAARPLLTLGDRKTVVKLANKIVAEGWSARKVEEEVARMMEPSTGGSRSSGNQKDASTRKLEERLRARFTAKAEVKHKKNGSGQVTLHYANLDDLDRILEMLGIK